MLVLAAQAFALTNSLQSALPQQHLGAAPISVTTGVTSAAVVVANGTRTGLVCTNIGTYTVFLAVGNTAVASSGIAILANTTWKMDAYTFSTQAVNAISASASTLSCNEFN